MFSYRYHFLCPNYALDQFWASRIEIFNFLKFIMGELCLDFLSFVCSVLSEFISGMGGFFFYLYKFLADVWGRND